MKLVIQVDPRRDREGTLALQDASGKIVFGPVPVCATADESMARRQGNALRDPLRPGGHPPFGTYGLVEVAPVAAAERGTRGPFALSFEPRTGDAVNAESHGRLLLELHGGTPGSDGALRPTDGGLRAADDVIEALAARLHGSVDCELQLQAVRESWWSRLFRRRRVLGESEPAERGTSWSSSDASSASEPAFSGRGGEFSGAGASASWDATTSAPAAAATGAALATGAAIAAGAVLAASEPETAGASDAADSPVTESDSAATDSESAATDSDSAASDTASETTTSTGY